MHFIIASIYTLYTCYLSSSIYLEFGQPNLLLQTRKSNYRLCSAEGVYVLYTWCIVGATHYFTSVRLLSVFSN